MTRAIGIAALLVLASFVFVFLQLQQHSRSGSAAMAAPGERPLLENDENLEVYDVREQVRQFEQRLVEAETRAARVDELSAGLEELKKERSAHQGRVQELQDEVERLRKDLARPRPAPQGEPSEQPESNVPVTPAAPATPPEGPPG